MGLEKKLGNSETLLRLPRGHNVSIEYCENNTDKTYCAEGTLRTARYPWHNPTHAVILTAAGERKIPYNAIRVVMYDPLPPREEHSAHPRLSAFAEIVKDYFYGRFTDEGQKQRGKELG